MIFDSLEQLDAYRESERKVTTWIYTTADVKPELSLHFGGADCGEEQSGTARGTDGERGTTEDEARSCCFSVALLVPYQRMCKRAEQVQIWSGSSSRRMVSSERCAS